MGKKIGNPPENEQLIIPGGFEISESSNGRVVQLIDLNHETSQILSTDISHIKIPIDPSQECYTTLGELVTSSKISLSRTFNIGLGREPSKEVLISLFSLNIDYTKISNIRYGEVQKPTIKYPHPKTLNKKTTPEVKQQIGNITTHTLGWYNGKSITELLAGALPTQTFWDFAIMCLKNGIKLNP